jgi:hypothetical protein
MDPTYNTVAIAIDAELIAVDTDALDVRVTHRYPDFSMCTASPTTSGPCEIVWDIRCVADL